MNTRFLSSSDRCIPKTYAAILSAVPGASAKLDGGLCQPECHVQPPTITGTYSNANYDFFLKPALQDFQSVGSALKTMARSAAVALRGDGCCQYHQLRDDITALEASRSDPQLPGHQHIDVCTQ